MTKRTRATSWMAVALLACAAVAHVSASSAAGLAQAGADAVKVTVKYTGKGTIDPQHRVWIWLFDTPDIGPGSMPIGEMSVDKDGSTATFSGVTAQKVWIAVAYDEAGGFMGAAPPPSGSPVAVHMSEAGTPAPITPGAKSVVTITFNDTQRMP